MPLLLGLGIDSLEVVDELVLVLEHLFYLLVLDFVFLKVLQCIEGMWRLLLVIPW